MQTTVNFDFLHENHIEGNLRVSILEGGSRSGKTWSIIQFLVFYCITNKNKGLTIIVARDYLTALRTTILPDFIDILKLYGLYRDQNFNKSEMVYTLYGNTIRFMGLDSTDKVHGAKSDIVWINEAISTDKNTVLQLMQRCSGFVLFDYNPSTSSHWVYELEKREDARLLRTTLLDNPFIPEEVRKQILGYEPTERNKELGTADAFMWKVYGEGMRADGEQTIFRSYEIVDSLPAHFDRMAFGLDYGYSNDPTACILVIVDGNNLYLDEQLYSTGLLNSDIRQAIGPIVGRKVVVPDSAEPKSNDELLYSGLNIVPAEKGRDSILYGLDLMRSKKLHVTASSTNLLNEFKNYTFVKDKTGVVTNRPIDKFNHGIDAARYATMFLLKKYEEIII